MKEINWYSSDLSIIKKSMKKKKTPTPKKGTSYTKKMSQNTGFRIRFQIEESSINNYY